MASKARRSVRDLSGCWQGQYRYSWGEAVPFLASLTQTGSQLSGDTVEPKGGGKFAFRTAEVSGACGGGGIQFTKSYLTPSATHRDPVHYKGEVSDDRRTIKGQWRVRGVIGTFEMQREAEIVDEVAAPENVRLGRSVRLLAPVNGGRP